MNNLRKILSLGLCAIGVVACGKDAALSEKMSEKSSGNSGELVTSAEQVRVVQAQPIVRGKEINAPIGKPSMAVQLKHFEYEMPADSTAELTVELISGLASGDLNVEVLGQEGLSVLQGLLHTISPVTAGHIPLRVNLASASAGKYILTLRLAHIDRQVDFPHKVLKVVVWAGGKPEASVQKQQAYPDKVVLPAGIR